MKITINPVKPPDVKLGHVKAGQCVRLIDNGEGIYMRTAFDSDARTPHEWVRLNDGQLFYTFNLLGNGPYMLVDAEVVVHG